MPTPWWLSHVAALELPVALDRLSLGALWHLAEGLRFVRDNVQPELLAQDVAATPGVSVQWSSFLSREGLVHQALSLATALELGSIRSGARSPAVFRAHWEALGFVAHAARDGTPADDYLDALFLTSRLSFLSSSAPLANVNLASRASRVSDFLSVVAPGRSDVVFDLGSGSGKLALTVAASSVATVQGVELLESAVDEANGSAVALGLQNVTFHRADVRDVDLSAGSVFYLYFPFRGEVASSVAATLGALARQKDITVYASGPVRDYGEYFAREVEQGAFRPLHRRGEFDEVLVLRSARS
ncbi:MAG: class I SAM-dependent methyltransferase [Myxococcales bacterium]|nr:class I SAM-dependent methyltransferase [Myxococcales bacterium]